MKIRLIGALVLILLTGSITTAQNNKQRDREDKIHAYRIAFLTEKMDLNITEAEKFWPVYNEMKKETEVLRKSFKPEKRPQNMNDEEALAFLERQLDFDESLLRLKRNYLPKLLNVVPAHKLARMKQAEMEFNKMVLNRVKNQMQPNNRKRQMN